MALSRHRLRSWSHWSLIVSGLLGGAWYLATDLIWSATFAAVGSGDHTRLADAVAESAIQTTLLNALVLPTAALLFLGSIGTLIALRLTRPPPQPRHEALEEQFEEEDEDDAQQEEKG